MVVIAKNDLGLPSDMLRNMFPLCILKEWYFVSFMYGNLVYITVFLTYLCKP